MTTNPRVKLLQKEIRQEEQAIARYEDGKDAANSLLLSIIAIGLAVRTIFEKTGDTKVVLGINITLASLAFISFIVLLILSVYLLTSKRNLRELKANLEEEKENSDNTVLDNAADPQPSA